VAAIHGKVTFPRPDTLKLRVHLADTADMDRRREPRIRTYQTVELTVLVDGGFSISAHATQFSSHGMRLVLERPIPVNAPVRICCDDWMVLGEVCHCNPERSHYIAGIHLDQALVGLEELAARSEKPPPATAALPGLDKDEQLLA
jgi:hypothetical protein